MEELNLDHLRHTVLWATFAVGALFGLIAHRSHFCTMGAVADVVNFGDWNRMRAWALAIGVAGLGLQTMAVTGNAQLADTIYLGSNWSWLSTLLGGALFGAGMVLASGCGSKTLIRLGAGNLKALVVFLALGFSSAMTLKGLFGVFRAQWLDPIKLDLGTAATLPSLLGSLGGSDTLATAFSLGIPALIIVLALSNKSAWTKETLLGGIGIGLTVLAAWWVVFQVAYLPEHPDTLEAAYLGTYANRAEGFTFVAPYAHTLEWLSYFSDTSRLLTVGMVACFGVVLGATASALAEGSFRWETFQGVEDTANHLVGGVLMGFGGVLAMGCTVGQGLSGVSTLATASWVALLAIIGGAVLAIKYQTWRVERMM